jgi:hypothetical protein
VEEAALDALKRQQEQQWVGKLLSGLTEATPTRCWNLLFAALDVGDPYLLGRNGDLLCVWSILDGLPPEYAIFAEDQLEKRRKANP